ncbi:unnamed protein product [Oncorhynchus mykiss]|uniref:Aquaporin n=1 Tax=Oncorhynchus mykiss TaxID=8022 RepID=A0A060XEW4_ONCMY|nr:unnamed protein product [Oncorhynchus mykiss]
MLAELLGSLVFVSAVLGASVPGPGEASTGPLYPALAAGMVAVALGHCFGEISGAQVNLPFWTYGCVSNDCKLITMIDCQFELYASLSWCSSNPVSVGHAEAGPGEGPGIRGSPVSGGLPGGRGSLLRPAPQNHRRLLRQQGSSRGERGPGSRDGASVNVPAGLHCVLRGGPPSEGVHRTREPGHRLLSQRRRAHRGSVLWRQYEPGTFPGSSHHHWLLGKPLGKTLHIYYTLSLSFPLSSMSPSVLTIPHPPPQVYWIGPVLGAVLAGVSHEFFFAPSASRQKLVACLTCKDIEMVEATSVSRSSLSTVTQTAMRAKQVNKQEQN